MQILKSYTIGVDQGEQALFSDFEDGGPMWSETGPREARIAIKYSQSYAVPPTVHVSLSMWDLDSKSNPRADLKSENVTTQGFDLVFRTWSDTRVARVRASWMSIGQVGDDEQWELL